MRISTAFYFQTGLNSLNRQQGELTKVFQQLGSAKRLITPADDPLAAAQTLTLSQSQSMNKRFAENREVALRNLGEEENVLSSLIPQVYNAKTRLIEAANGTLADADRNSLAQVFTEMRDSIANLANAQDSDGQYLFSGSKGNEAPFVKQNDGSYTYAGDTNGRLIQVDQTRQLSGSDNGKDLFLRATPGSNAYLSGADKNNLGTGVVGGINVKSGNEAASLANTITIQYNEADKQFTVDKDGDVSTIDYDPETASGTLDLGGITVNISGTPKDGDRFSFDKATAKDHDDSLNILNTLNEVIAALGTPTDADPAAKAHMQNTLNGAMQRLDLNYDNLLTVRASVGTRMNEIDALKDVGSLQQLHLTSEMSRLEDLNMYSALTELEMRSAALEAAAIAFKKIQSTNLFAINARG